LIPIKLESISINFHEPRLPAYQLMDGQNGHDRTAAKRDDAARIRGAIGAPKFSRDDGVARAPTNFLRVADNCI